jgi:hypothetical protein
MLTVVKLLTDDGPLFVEIDETTLKRTAGWLEDVSSEGREAGKVLDLAASISNAVAVSFSQVRKGLTSLKPDEIEVELGLKLSGEAGGAWVLAKASGEANIKISAKWISQGGESIK